MAEEKFVDQQGVNKIWAKQWQEERPSKNVFTQRLFVEGYPIFRKYFPADPQQILDVGGGTGRYGIRFAQEFPKAKVFVTDILDESLEVARSIASDVGVSNVVTLKEDVNALSFSNGMFDVVFCDVVIQHLPDVSNAMSEMHRVLKPGGRLIVSVNNFWNPHSLYKFFKGKSYQYGYEKSYTRKELHDLFRTHDVEVTAEDGFYPAYAFYRLRGAWRLLGKILNRLNRYVDPWTGRFLSRHFGFEIFCVGRK